MSIEGRGASRDAIRRASEDAGWLVSDRPVRGCLFHVAPDADTASRSAEAARRVGIPVASYDEWTEIAQGLADVLAHEIGDRVGTNRLQDEEVPR